MERIYGSPLRVYLLLGLLAVAGVICGFRLPVSLFPNSSKPMVVVSIPYGNSTAAEFFDMYGRELESNLRGISVEDLEVEQVIARYEQDSVRYRVIFKWETSSKAALQEVGRRVNIYATRFSFEMRQGMEVWTNSENNGFLAISFFSDSRSLEDLYGLLEPVMMPKIREASDAESVELYDPTQKEIVVEIDPLRAAILQLLPRDIEQAVGSAVRAMQGGSLMIGTDTLTIEMPRQAYSLEQISRIRLATPSGALISLGDVAKVDWRLQERESRKFKTSGADSLILFASPRPGGNVKRMAENIIAAINSVRSDLPKDVQYRVLVDPSAFIRKSISNVMHEVILGCLLAVGILFFFIGSLRNTITAAIEIPMSMVLAFIMMRASNMNLNLISLGGLALSAGMNIDASVVVMENIFRHFEEVIGPLSYRDRLRIIVNAVREVRFCVVASTIASLVVFLPLAFTSDLTYAILGDLARAVVYSHGFSAVVALILVPTVRLQLMSFESPTRHTLPKSPIQGFLNELEAVYSSALRFFISTRALKFFFYAALPILLIAMGWSVLPRLPREIIGMPDSDWVTLSMSTGGNTMVRQMETSTAESEARLLKKFEDRILYTFTQIYSPNNAFVMARLKDKRDAHKLLKDLETEFTNTPYLQFHADIWNPSELPIPNPPDLRIAITGGELKERRDIAQNLADRFKEKNLYPSVWTWPPVDIRQHLVIRPHLEQWAIIEGKARLTLADLPDVARVATSGRPIEKLTIGSRPTPLRIAYSKSYTKGVEDLAAFPVGIGGKIVPMRALAELSREVLPPLMYREDGQDLIVIQGYVKRGDESRSNAILAQANSLVSQWETENKERLANNHTVVRFEDAKKDLNTALRQLALAVGLSILLIFATLVIQFGNVMNAVLVMVAVPLGFVGVIASLWICGSTLSLNSVLGVILLNGIAVGNSILLVDFLRRGVEEGKSPFEAAIQAGKKRLRPILITSLTTIFAMIPIAIGYGEGGKILQPLGIGVAGGLWVSTMLTLFIVPALQVDYLRWRKKRC